MSNSAFIYSEARLAKFINMTRKTIAEARAKLLTPEEAKNQGGEIALTREGVVRLLHNFELPETDVDLSQCLIQTLAEKKNGAGVPLPEILSAPPGSAPVPIKMRVRRIFPNPRLIEACEAARPTELYQVLVPSNANFTVGLEFQAIPDPANAGFWRLHGVPPRWRGRW